MKVNDDGTPKGTKGGKNRLPRTGGSDTMVYYLGGAMLIFLASGIVVRRKKVNK